MNDYAFGNYLYGLRVRLGYTQAQVAAALGVTNKAVSKWENGKAMPSTGSIRKLAALYAVSADELLSRKQEKNAPEITKIVITGGPCAGKTTGMSWVQNALTERGYRVLFVPETATELITGGVAPWTCGSNIDYQKCQVSLQLAKEEVFDQAARTMAVDKILIVCDRGVLDNKAYMKDAEFSMVCSDLGLDEVTLRDSYDAVFHLVTAAKGADEFYTTANNSARTETAKEAAEMDDRLIAAWTGHPHLRVIGNDQDFDSKMRTLIHEITSFLGEPEPYEIEHKFLIDYPDVHYLQSLPNCQKVEIIQTYLKSEPGSEIRVRQRGMNGSYIYFRTEKKPVSAMKRVELECRLTEKEYLTALMDADTTMHPIRKDRYCLTWNNQYFEIDIYPFWQDKAIVEIELTDENQPITFPDFLHVQKEVTDDKTYSNYALAGGK